ncbi:hypothetical protein P4S72_18585 [Vibrio sp. PP-XX7]
MQQQGFNEKQALHLEWLSKDMNEHERHMADFMTVFQILERWGPGTDAVEFWKHGIPRYAKIAKRLTKCAKQALTWLTISP